MADDLQKQWQPVIDEAAFTPLGQNLPPEAELGAVFIEHDDQGRMARRWFYVEIRYGSGQWAYWLNPSKHQVCADVLHNPNAAHFAGFLAKPHHLPQVRRDWVLVDPHIAPKPVQYIKVEDEERSQGRYERNDVDRIIPIPKPKS